MKIGMSAPRARQGQGERHQLPIVECADDLPADFLRHHKHAQRHQFGFGEIPDFFLQRNAGRQFIQVVALADHHRALGHPASRLPARSSSCNLSLACCHSDSSSAIEACCGPRPEARNCSSIH